MSIDRGVATANTVVAATKTVTLVASDVADARGASKSAHPGGNSPGDGTPINQVTTPSSTTGAQPSAAGTAYTESSAIPTVSPQLRTCTSCTPPTPHATAATNTPVADATIANRPIVSNRPETRSSGRNTRRTRAGNSDASAAGTTGPRTHSTPPDRPGTSIGRGKQRSRIAAATAAISSS